MGEVMVPDCDVLGDKAVFIETLRSRKWLSKARIEESNSV